VHDLDLRVTHNGKRLYSNFGAAETGTYAGEEDTQNNVEKTTIASSTLSVGESIAVVVTTDSGLAGDDSQKFALVVTGNVVVLTPSLTVSPNPTSIPIPTPSGLPTSNPTLIPTPIPIPTPSESPTFTPSEIPTLAPTSKDTFSVSATIAIASTQSTISTSERSTLKNTVATTIGVASTYITNFAVTITPARRRRHLLASYTWTTSFDLVASLSTTTASSAADFTETMTTSLETSLATNVQADMGLTVTVSDVSTIIATRNPSPQPSKQPSMNSPSEEPAKSNVNSDSSISTGAIIGTVVAAIFVCLCGAAVIFKLYKEQIIKYIAEGIRHEDSPVHSNSTHSLAQIKNDSNVELTGPAFSPASKPAMTPRSADL